MLLIGTTKYNTILVIVNHYTKIAKFILTTINLATPKFTALLYKNTKPKYGSLRGIVSN
jgi:hypothetical protein